MATTRRSASRVNGSCTRRSSDLAQARARQRGDAAAARREAESAQDQDDGRRPRLRPPPSWPLPCSSRPRVRAPDVAIPAPGHGLLAEPAIFARKLDLGDLLDLGLAVHEVAAVDRDRHGAAMVGRGPGRRQADAFEALRHPVLLGIHAFLDVLAGDPAVGLRPLHRLLHVIDRADAADVVVGRLLGLGEAALVGDLAHELHAGRVLVPERRGRREDVVLGLRRLDGRLVARPDVGEIGDVEADRVARLDHGDDRAAEIADEDVVGAQLLDGQALRLEVAGLERNDDRRQHFKSELVGKGAAGLLRRVRIRMVVAGVEVFRLGDALGFGIAGGPLHHRAAGIRVRGAIEEVVGRRLFGVRVLAARVGQMAGVGGRQHRHLVVGDEANQRLGVAGAPALQRDHAFALPALVVGDCVRDLVGVVDCFHVDRRARNPAVGVDEVDRVAHARSVILADESGRAGVIDQLADEHLVLCQRRECGAREEAAHGHNSPFHVVSPKGRSTGVPGRFAAASAGS